MEDKNLSLLLDRLVSALNPLEVYLFGSRARGTARPDSDYDLLFVVPDDAPAEKYQIMEITKPYRDIKVDADVVPCELSRFLHRQNMTGTLSFESKHEGIKVYAET